MHQRTRAAKTISTGRRQVARVRTSRRKLAVAVPAALVAAGAFVAIPAASASSTVFPTMNDSGGVYWRSGTNWNTPIAKSGYGVYPGTKISVSCYQMGTANVPGSADAMWVKASWASGPGTGSGWINEHFVNDGAPINKAAPGVPSCTPTPSPSSSTETSTEAAAVKWAESMVGSNLGTSGQKYWLVALLSRSTRTESAQITPRSTMMSPCRWGRTPTLPISGQSTNPRATSEQVPRGLTTHLRPGPWSSGTARGVPATVTSRSASVAESWYRPTSTSPVFLVTTGFITRQ